MSNFLYIIATMVALGCLLVSGAFVLAGLVNLFTCGVNWPLWILAIIVMIVSSFVLGDLLGD